MKKYLIRIGVLSAVIIMLLSITACSKKEAEEESTEMPNPWSDVDSAEAAAEGAGIEALKIADGIELSLGEVKVDNWRCMKGMVEASVPFPAVQMTVRKGSDDLADEKGDISGDYNDYKHSWTQEVNKINVECFGNREGEATKTIFKSGDYLYSVTAHGEGGDDDYGLSADDLLLIVGGIDDIANAEGVDSLAGNKLGYSGNDPAEMAVYTYLTDEIAGNYDKADCSIPVVTVIDVDKSNPEDVKIKGDYWIYNYNIEGDTLKCVSGGAHPGCLHIKPSDNGTYEVIGFDAVKDGSDYETSAKEIFGDKYDEFIKCTSDDKAREARRLESVSLYVNANEVPVTKYQDEGWDPVDLHL